MIYFNSQGDEFIKFFINSIKKFTSNEGRPIGICVSLNESNKQISIHYNVNKELNKKDKSIEQFEFQEYDLTKYSFSQSKRKTDIVGNRKINLWKSIRKASKEIELPTVLYHLENSGIVDMPIETETELFGRSVVKYFRDEVMDFHRSLIIQYEDKSIEEIRNSFQENLTEESRNETLRNASLFTRLNKNELDILNDYVLKIIDFSSFNVMRALDEKTGYDGSNLNVEVNGIGVTNLNLIGNGNLSGEYLDWIDRFSKFKEFQT